MIPLFHANLAGKSNRFLNSPVCYSARLRKIPVMIEGIAVVFHHEKQIIGF
jgi:hypothetical protein